MQAINQVLNTKLNSTTSTSNNILNITSITGTELNSNSKYNYDCDKLYEMHKSLCGLPKLRGYYIKAFYKLGQDRVNRLASIAKQDGTYFGWLIKRELAK